MENTKKKKTNYWTKKKLFTVRFKGRKARALLWRKKVYGEWFEYAKLHQKNGGTIPKQFGDLQSFNTFEDWWRHPEFGFELFCEPFMRDKIKILDEPPTSIEPDHILIDIDLNADKDKLIQRLTKILNQKNVSDEYQSRARFQPSQSMKHIKTDKLKLFRETWILINSGLTHKDVVDKLNLLPKEPSKSNKMAYNFYWDRFENMELTALRKVSRHKKSVNDTFNNIERGTFP